MRIIDGTPIDQIEQRFDVFKTEIESINDKTLTDRKTIVEIQQQATNLSKSLDKSIADFNKAIVKTNTDLSQSIEEKAKELLDHLSATQTELSLLITRLNNGSTEVSNEELGARLAILENVQQQISDWKKLLTDTDTDNVVNTMTEMLAMFKDMPEDAGSFLDLLGKKVDKNSIINDLTTGGADNILSAEMGKWLMNNKLSNNEILLGSSGNNINMDNLMPGMYIFDLNNSNAAGTHPFLTSHFPTQVTQRGLYYHLVVIPTLAGKLMWIYQDLNAPLFQMFVLCADRVDKSWWRTI